MSELEDLQRKIYRKAPDISERPEDRLSPPQSAKPEVAWGRQKEHSFLLRNIWLFITAAVVIIGGLSLLFFGTSGFSEDKVLVNIDVAREVTAIELVQWKVTIENTNNIALENVELRFRYPENSTPFEDIHLEGGVSRVSLGTIEAGQDLNRIFHARLFGEEDEIKTVTARISFMTAGISRELSKEVAAQTKIKELPLVFDARGPQNLRSGEEASWIFTFRNNSSLDLASLRARIDYPQGFTFIGADPPANFESNIWEIPSLKIGQERVITVKGILTGSLDEQKSFNAFLEFPLGEGAYVSLARKIVTTKLVLSPLSLSLLVNDEEALAANTGESLNAVLTYRNNITEEINDMVLTLTMLGEMLDIPSVESDGNFDVGAKIVTWNESTTPSLARLRPGESASVNVSFNVKNTFNIKSFSDKNFSLRLLGEIKSLHPPGFLRPEATIQRKEFVIPINTQVKVQVVGEYRTAGGSFINTGGIPPSVGKQTTYNIIWRVTNTSNDVKDFEIISTLPAWATFTGLKKANFAEEGLFFDSTSRRMIWNVNRLPSGTGFVLPVYEAAFQIGVSPESKHIGSVIDIIGSSQVKGVDEFTNQVINFLSPPVRTDLNGTLREGQARVTG